MVYVLSKTGKALMPTQRNGKVRRLLRDGLAVVVKREHFTIQLCYETTELIWQNVRLTHGYITKNTRIANGLEIDARCISGDPLAIPCAQQCQMRQVANHTRSLHVQNTTRGDRRRSTIAPHFIGGTWFRRYDKVI